MGRGGKNGSFLGGFATHTGIKVETHDATNLYDTSLQQVAATNRLV